MNVVETIDDKIKQERENIAKWLEERFYIYNYLGDATLRQFVKKIKDGSYIRPKTKYE